MATSGFETYRRQHWDKNNDPDEERAQLARQWLAFGIRGRWSYHEPQAEVNEHEHQAVISSCRTEREREAAAFLASVHRIPFESRNVAAIIATPPEDSQLAELEREEGGECFVIRDPERYRDTEDVLLHLPELVHSVRGPQDPVAYDARILEAAEEAADMINNGEEVNETKLLFQHNFVTGLVIVLKAATAECHWFDEKGYVVRWTSSEIEEVVQWAQNMLGARANETPLWNQAECGPLYQGNEDV
jgi:hypothetical protein